MKRTNKKMFAVLVGMLLISFAVVVPALAQAEQCSPDGKICLVTDTSQPLLPPTTLQFRVTSEAIEVLVNAQSTAVRDVRLVQSGPEMNVWEATLTAGEINTDGLVSLEVRAGSMTTLWQATFTATGLAQAVNYEVTIHRTKQRVMATYQFEARTTLTAVVQIWLDSFKGGTQILAHRGTSQTVGPGIQTLTVVFPRKVIDRKCGTTKYPHCSVLATGRLWSGQYMVDQGTNDRKSLKVHRHHRK